MGFYRSQKHENPDNPFNFGEYEKITGAPYKPHSQQSSYVGSIVICPKSSRLSELTLLRIGQEGVTERYNLQRQCGSQLPPEEQIRFWEAYEAGRATSSRLEPERKCTKRRRGEHSTKT